MGNSPSKWPSYAEKQAAEGLINFSRKPFEIINPWKESQPNTRPANAVSVAASNASYKSKNSNNGSFLRNARNGSPLKETAQQTAERVYSRMQRSGQIITPTSTGTRKNNSSAPIKNATTVGRTRKRNSRR